MAARRSKMIKTQLLQAINQALVEEMERDDKVIVVGEDVEGGSFADIHGLFDRFGPTRVKNTSISASSLSHIAASAVTNGNRIVLHTMSNSIVETGYNAIVNHLTKLCFMEGEQTPLPITIISCYGNDQSTEPQRSLSPLSVLMGIAGVEVVVPSNPSNAKGLMKAAIRSDNPTFYLEPGGRGGDTGDVSAADYTTPFGHASLIGHGSDLTLITMGSMTRMTVQTAQKLKRQGVSVEVLDLQTLVPLDEAAILRSVAKTGRVVIIDESRDICSAASHIAAIIAERAFSSLKAPIRRITVLDTAKLNAPSLEQPLVPNSDRILSAASDLLGKELT